MRKGQSLVEMVVSVGLVILVTTGIVALLIQTLSVRRASFDRKEATDLAQKVTENLINDKQSDPGFFWKEDASGPVYWYQGPYGDGTTNAGVDIGYSGYNFELSWIQRKDVGTSCDSGSYNCAEVTVNVGWSGSSETVQYSRFFSKD